MRRLALWLFLLHSCLLTRTLIASECGLQQLLIEPIEPARTDLFVGKGKTVEVEFHNSVTGLRVDVFPESPLTVRRRPPGTTCEIEGGVWVRQAIYLSVDEKTLVVQEFSGSNDSLVFYDTATCRKRREVDVSGARWKVSPNRIDVGRHCATEDLESCRSRKDLVLDRSCRLKPTPTRKGRQ